MRRVLAVVAGVVGGNALYYSLALGVLQPVQQASGDSPEEWMGVVFYVLMPLCLVAGGVLTGYMVRTLPEPARAFAILHAPGLYTALLVLPTLRNTIPSFQAFMLFASVVWVFSSTVGVLLGTRFYRYRVPAV